MKAKPYLFQTEKLVNSKLSATLCIMKPNTMAPNNPLFHFTNTMSMPSECPKHKRSPNRFFPLITQCCTATPNTVQALPTPVSRRHIQHHLVLIPAVKRKTRAFPGHVAGTHHCAVPECELPRAPERFGGGNSDSKARPRPAASTPVRCVHSCVLRRASTGSGSRGSSGGVRRGSARERAFPAGAQAPAGLSRPELGAAPGADGFQGEALVRPFPCPPP